MDNLLNKNNKVFFLASLLGHGLLVFSFSFTVFQAKIKNNSTVFLPAYLSQPSFILQKNADQLTPPNKNGIHKKILTKPSTSQSLNHVTSNKKSHLSPQEQSYTQEKDIDQALLKMIHDSAAEHLSYPAMAIELNQTGIVTIGFLISADGALSNIILLKSSGFDALDNAALIAVKAVPPIPNTSPYLHSPVEHLAIDIVFK
jgi:TonB family protein